MRRARNLLLILVAVVLLLVAVSEIVSESFHPEARRELLESRLSQALGLDVRVTGGLDFGLLPQPHISLEGIEIANLPGRPSPHLAEIAQLDLALEVWPLLQGRVEIDRLELTGVDLRLEPTPEGWLAPEHHAASLLDDEPDATDGGVDFSIREVEVEALQVFYRDAATHDVKSARFDSISLRSRAVDAPVEVRVRGAYEGGTFELDGVLPSPFGSASAEPRPVELHGRLLEARVDATGSVVDLVELRGWDISISGAIPDVDAFFGEFPRGLPGVGDVVFSGRLRRLDGRWALDDVDVAATSDGLDATLRGSVRDLARMGGVGATVAIRRAHVRLLENALDRPLPGAWLSGTAVLRGDGDRLGAELDLRSRGVDDAIDVRLHGTIGDLGALRDVSADLEVRADSLAGVGRALALERPLPDLGPLQATAHVRDSGALGLHDIDLSIGSRSNVWVEAQGTIHDVLSLRSLEIRARFGGTDLSRLHSYLGHPLPNLGTLEGSIQLADADGSLGIERLEIRGGKKGRFEIDLRGSLDDITALEQIQLDAKLAVRDLALFGDLIGTELPAIEDVEFAGTVSGSDDELVSKGRLRLDETRFDGEWVASFPPGRRPSIRAKLRSPQVHLDDIGLEPRLLAEAEPLPQPPWWTGSDPIPFERLRAIDGVLDVRAERVTGRSGFEAQHLESLVALDDGALHIRRVSADTIEGRIECELRIDARTPVPTVALRGDATGINIGHLLAQVRESPEEAGRLDVSLDLRSHGQTRDAIRRNLSGHADALLRDGVLASQYARRFLTSFARVALPTLGLQDRKAPVSCFSASFEISSGTAEVQELRLEANSVTVGGTGRIDLGERAFDLRLTPVPHEPGLLTVAATVDVVGPLSDPTFKPVPQSLATSAARALVANALRPGRVVLDRLRGSKAPNPPVSRCDTPVPGVASAGPQP